VGLIDHTVADEQVRILAMRTRWSSNCCAAESGGMTSAKVRNWGKLVFGL